MSHLNYLQKSSIPSRVEIQGLLTDVDLQTKFASDVRKFSQAHVHERARFAGRRSLRQLPAGSDWGVRL